MSIINLCPKLLAKAISIDDENSIKFTMQLLAISKKLKIRKFGINTFNDPDLIKEHKGWLFDEEQSIFSTKQSINRFPAVWEVSSKLNDW